MLLFKANKISGLLQFYFLIGMLLSAVLLIMKVIEFSRFLMNSNLVHLNTWFPYDLVFWLIAYLLLWSGFHFSKTFCKQVP